MSHMYYILYLKQDDHTNLLFLNSHDLKFRDLLYYKTMQMVFKANTLPDYVQFFLQYMKVNIDANL